MRRCGAGILVFVILCSFLGGCSIEKVRAGDGVTPEYTVMKEEDFPEKVKELINENKEKYCIASPSTKVDKVIDITSKGKFSLNK